MPTPPQATLSRRSTRVAVGLVLAALVWLGVMWVASPAGAFPADGSVGSASSVASTAADTTPSASSAPRLHETLDAALAPAAPVLDAVEPVLTTTVRLPDELLAAADPIVEPVVVPVVVPVTAALEELTAPVLDALPQPSLPGSPLPAPPPLPLVPSTDLDAAPVDVAVVEDPASVTSIDPGAADTTEQLGTSHDDLLRRALQRSYAADVPGPIAPALGPATATTAPASDPAVPAPAPAPFDVTAPATSSPGTERVPSLGVLVAAPGATASRHHTVRLAASRASSRPAPPPPFAPD